MKRTLLLSLTFLSLGALASGQTSGQATFEIPVQRLTQGGEAGTTRQNVGGTFSVERMLGDERVRLFYDLALDSFGAPDSLSTWLHNGGATVAFGDARRALELGGSVFWRANQGEWADAGFAGVNLLTLGRFRPVPQATLTATYAFYARQFADQPALDQLEHHGAFEALANLRTRTTLVARLAVGAKRYDGREVILTPGAPAAPGSPETITGTRGWRRGGFIPVTESLMGEPGTRQQWSWTARVAQSLTDRTGVWIQHERRHTSGDLPPAIVWTPPLFYDDGVYDDPYVIDLQGWRGGVKHVFLGGAELGGWFVYADREYAGLVRADALTRAGGTAVVPLIDGTRAALAVVAEYGWTKNESSDALESYRAHAASLGLRVRF